MCHGRPNRNPTTYRTEVVPGVVSTLVHDTRGMAVKLAHRRRFLHLAAGAAALPAVSRVAWAQAYPARSARVVVPIAAGGANDVTARLVGQWLSERLGQQFFIENVQAPVPMSARHTVVSCGRGRKSFRILCQACSRGTNSQQRSCVAVVPLEWHSRGRRFDSPWLHQLTT
jgi:hypothetical protein